MSGPTTRFTSALLLAGFATACGVSDSSRAAGGSGRAPDDPIVVVARARDGRLWAPAARGAAEAGDRPVFVMGVNFGVALPGRWPSEFPEDEATYAGWIDTVAAMGANTIRTYTLLPPPFYDALETHNRKRPQQRLWLLQGVWTELPEGDNYHAPGYLDGFKDEIRRVIDALHGDLDLAPRPGHASGRYRADVSASVLGWVLGREWEPYSVRAYDRKRGGDVAAGGASGAASFHGGYMVVERGTPFEAWLAGVLDFAVAHETTRYRMQRPVSFVSWPTLDPMTHPTEATVAEETAWRRRRGEDVSSPPIFEYDNDGVTVDPTRIRATAAAAGGLFATYHAYPYYPDFMQLDPGYAGARGVRGPSRYLGYLRDLKTHHADLPIVIGEFGVPSSRGQSHYHPQGWHHGGLSERDQAEIDALLMRDIREAGMAGGVVFALLDEWFKRNWLVAEFEVPADRKPFWLNVLDPEQHYGILAARPGAAGWKVTIDGRGEDWAGIAPLLARAGAGPERPLGDGHDGARTLRGLRVASDEAYLYLRLDVDDLDADDDGRPEWDRAAYLVGIDTHDERLGDHRLPLRDAPRSPVGLEFCAILDGPGTSRLLVDTPYDIHTHRYRRPYRSVENDDGRYIPIRVETNRRRICRDGKVHQAREHNRSPLLHGSIDPRDADHDSRADWRAGRDGTFIEMRIAWGLLNVTDPSSRRVLHDDPGNLKAIGTRVTPGFRFVVASYRPEGPAGGHPPLRGRLADRLPATDWARDRAGDGSRAAAGAAPAFGDAADPPVYAWPTWDQPTWRIEKKEVWTRLRDTFADLARQESAR
jgi:hypothetical protein